MAPAKSGFWGLVPSRPLRQLKLSCRICCKNPDMYIQARTVTQANPSHPGDT